MRISDQIACLLLICTSGALWCSASICRADENEKLTASRPADRHGAAEEESFEEDKSADARYRTAVERLLSIGREPAERKLAAAKTCFHAAEKKHSGDAVLCSSYGLALVKGRRYSEAIQVLELATRGDSSAKLIAQRLLIRSRYMDAPDDFELGSLAEYAKSLEACHRSGTDIELLVDCSVFLGRMTGFLLERQSDNFSLVERLRVVDLTVRSVLKDSRQLGYDHGKADVKLQFHKNVAGIDERVERRKNTKLKRIAEVSDKIAGKDVVLTYRLSQVSLQLQRRLAVLQAEREGLFMILAQEERELAQKRWLNQRKILALKFKLKKAPSDEMEGLRNQISSLESTRFVPSSEAIKCGERVRAIEANARRLKAQYQMEQRRVTAWRNNVHAHVEKGQAEVRSASSEKFRDRLDAWTRSFEIYVPFAFDPVARKLKNSLN